MDKWEELKRVVSLSADLPFENLISVRTYREVKALMEKIETAELTDCSMPEVVDRRYLKPGE